MIKLKPCPFCGCRVLDLVKPDGIYPAFVMCKSCKATGPVACSSKWSAVLWDSRESEDKENEN